MNRFRFRLQRLLDVKLTIEAQRQQALVECQTALLHAQGEADAISRRIEGLHQRLRGARTGDLDLRQEQMIADYLRRSNQELKQAHARVDECQMALEEARERLLDAMKERKSLEKLRDADLARYQKELARRDQAAMDEMAQRWSHRG